MRPAPIALLTDFGLDDPYVGQMRAVLARVLPDAPLMDISHGVPPHAVMSAALFLASSRPYFPDSTLFLCVVDPGVGSARPIHCAMQKGGPKHILLGPGNGLLSLAAAHMEQQAPVRWLELKLSAVSTAEASPTFHGRDLFPQLAAALRYGTPSALGTTLSAAPPLPEWAKARPLTDGFALTVLHVDRFGNCVLNLAAATELPETAQIHLPSAPEQALRRVTHYAALAPDDVGLLRGSQGYWELACHGHSAAALLGIRAGQSCTLRFPHKGTP